MRPLTLAQTLTALAEGANPGHDQLAIEEAEIALPLILRFEAGAEGPVFLAHPPFSALRAGFEPVAHRARIRFALLPDPQPGPQPGPACPPAHLVLPETATATRPPLDGKG